MSRGGSVRVLARTAGRASAALPESAGLAWHRVEGGAARGGRWVVGCCLRE